MKPTATYDQAANTLAITFQGETRTFSCYCVMNERVTAPSVFSGRFRTGTKRWPLSATLWFKSGNLVIDNGGFANKGGVVAITGWWDADNKANTQHKGAR